MGRPKKNISINLVANLAAHGCTTEEIGTIVGCSKDTLERRFSAVLKKGRANMKMSLRRRQMKLAMEGNATMLIWLGKQYLKQKDKRESPPPPAVDASPDRTAVEVAAMNETILTPAEMCKEHASNEHSTATT